MTRVKKQFLATTAFLACSFAMTSHAAYSQQGAFDGFYAGINAGGTQTNSSPSLVSNETDTGAGQLTGFASGSGQANNSSANGGIEIGYGKQFGNFYLGAQLEGNAFKTTAEFSNGGGTAGNGFLNTTTQVKVENSYGISIIPGYLLAPDVLAYLQLGAINSYVKSNTNGTDTNTPNMPALGYSNSSNLWGFRLGVGVEKKISSNFSVGARYQYTNYGNLGGSQGIVNNGQAPATTFSGNTSVNSIYTHTFLATLRYYIS